jgi:hypothetical protein
VHTALLTLAIGLPLFISQPDLSRAAGHPLTAIFYALTLTIGLPFLLLSSTSPLLQLWLARQEHSGVTWKLFALSNAGSLLALVLYPTIIEPHFSLRMQRGSWITGFEVYAILSAVIAWRVQRSSSRTEAEPPRAGDAAKSSGPREAALVSASRRGGDPVVRRHQPPEPEHRCNPACCGCYRWASIC